MTPLGYYVSLKNPLLLLLLAFQIHKKSDEVGKKSSSVSSGDALVMSWMWHPT